MSDETAASAGDTAPPRTTTTASAPAPVMVRAFMLRPSRALGSRLTLPSYHPRARGPGNAERPPKGPSTSRSLLLARSLHHLFLVSGAERGGAIRHLAAPDADLVFGVRLAGVLDLTGHLLLRHGALAALSARQHLRVGVFAHDADQGLQGVFQLLARRAARCLARQAELLPELLEGARVAVLAVVPDVDQFVDQDRQRLHAVRDLGADEDVVHLDLGSAGDPGPADRARSEEHTSELQSH